MHPKFNKYKIGELFEVQLGKMLDERAKKGEQVDYLANFNVRWGAFDFSKLNQMNFSEKEKEKFSLICGDLLMCEGGEIGRCAVWKDERANIYYQKALHRIRAKSNKCTTDYLSLYFQYLAQTGQLTKFVGESSIAHLTRETLIGLHIFCPTLIQQKAIADLLATWDEAIEKTERLIQAKEKKFKRLLSTLICLPTAQGKWKETRLKNLFEERREINREDLPLLSITNSEGVIYREDTNRKDTSNDDKSKYLRICPGDIGYNTMRMWQGVSALSSLEGVVSPAYTICIPGEKVDPKFIAFLFKVPFMIHRFYRYSQGLTSDTWNLKFHHFGEVKMPLPSLPEQQKISELLETSQKEMSALTLLAEKYKSQKRGLMQKLLTGQWRIKPGVVKTFE